MVPALIGIALGECAILFDIANRVFGSYARTAPGAAKRIAFIDTPMTLLADENRKIEDAGVTLVGLEQPWSGKPLPQAIQAEFVLALSHTPDSIVLLPKLGAHLGVAGHTHGGRMRVPGLGPLIMPSKLGRFLDRGLFALGNSLLYIATGFGYFPSPRRPAEVLWLDIRRETRGSLPCGD